ncbi:MAG: LysR family transcriptional regulator [Burkholderiales bacterium]|nr:LysR family transcriptional regulator [Burkholderiales bacterium]
MTTERASRLPPLHDLTAFEAAARHMSFLKASEELHVTQSAISHRIKSLESFLGVALFIRVNRNIALTSFGERYLADVRETLTRLAEATARLGRTQERLRLAVAPALGAKWLVARLAGFQHAHPDIELVVSSSYGLDLLRRGEADLCIRYGPEPAAGLHCIKLFDETVAPVAAPAYVAALGGLATPAALARAQLLRHPLLRWRPWLAAAGLDWDEPVAGPLFEDAALMYEAAAAGQGVALAPRTVFAGYPEGVLVKPFDLEVWDSAYNIVVAPAARGRAAVTRFCDWLLAQGAGA